MAPSPPACLRVLVAAGDRALACELRHALERLGHQVSGPCATADALQAMLERRRPDVLLLDLRFGPDGDASGLGGRLRERHGLPVVLVAGGAWGPRIERAGEARPLACLMRPFGDAEVAAALALAGGSAAFPEMAAPAEPPKPAPPSPREPSADPPRPPSARGLALAKAAELSRQPAFRELLGRRAAAGGPDGGPPPAPAEDLGFFEEMGEVLDPLEEPPADEGPLAPFDEIGDPLMTLDSGWRVVGANARALVDFGGSSPLIGRDFWAGFAPGTRDRYGPEFERALAADEGRHHFEFQDVLSRRWHEVSAYRTASAGPGEAGLLALFRDITDRKKAEAEEIRSHRLEGLGLLARGFAHDFNNLLTVLIGSLELAGERFPDDAGFREEIGQASQAAGHARDLVQQLLTFSQGGHPIREKVRLADLIRPILAQRRKANPGIRYQFQSSGPALEAHVDRRQLARLVENLVTNAEQAMPGGGVLIVRCHRQTGAEVTRLREAPLAHPGDHAVIEVIDTGRGMSEDQLEHAFDPFFTTRSGANATGIGLTVCESIAKAHGGFILLQSKEGRGTIATLCVPLPVPEPASPAPAPENVFMPRREDAVAAAPAAPPARPDPPADGGVAGPARPATGRILVLEDDDLIRRLIAVTLRRDGHEVIETADGQETILAYRKALEAGDPFDLVLSDLTIVNGLGGIETLQALRTLDPRVVAIVSSGYSDAPAMARPADFGFSAVLPKPYPPRELRQLVQELLRRSPRLNPASPA